MIGFLAAIQVNEADPAFRSHVRHVPGRIGIRFFEGGRFMEVDDSTDVVIGGETKNHAFRTRRCGIDTFVGLRKPVLRGARCLVVAHSDTARGKQIQAITRMFLDVGV